MPLVPFEAMALYDNWPDYPMTCGAIFTLRGTIDRIAFRRAVHVAARRHPLVQSNLVRSRLGTWSWVPSKHPLEARWIGDADAEDFGSCHPFDLRSENGVRMWVQQRDDIGKVFVEFHHSCCDGAGGMSFIDDIFAVYAAETNGDAVKLPPLDSNLLKTRGKFATEGGALTRRLANFCEDVRFTSAMALRRPLALAHADRSATLSRQTWSHTRLVSRRFDRASYEWLRATAVGTAQAVTLNDYLVSRLFRTLRIWNHRFRPGETGCLRILVPVNLRNRRDMQMPLTNRLSYGFLTRHSEQILDDTNLIQSVAAENAHMRRIGLPRRLLEKFSLLQHTRLWPLIFSPRRCLATAVFSNLGDPTRRFRTRFPRTDGRIQVGNLLMTEFEGTTALRPMTRTGIFFNTYGNQLTISTRFDRSHFTISDAESFLDLFAAEIMANQHVAKRAA